MCILMWSCACRVRASPQKQQSDGLPPNRMSFSPRSSFLKRSASRLASAGEADAPVTAPAADVSPLAKIENVVVVGGTLDMVIDNLVSLGVMGVCGSGWL